MPRKKRNQLGQELDDNVNKILASAKLYFNAAAHNNAQLKKLIQYPLGLLDTSTEEIRTLCRLMVTPEKIIDLKAQVERLTDDVEKIHL